MLKGFTVIREEDLPDFNGHGILLKHERTGMKIFYFRPEKNKENYFCYNFKTPLSDDTGIAHALEHMVLQGSKNYPLKNNFVHLAKKSLASEMNAATGQWKNILMRNFKKQKKKLQQLLLLFPVELLF